MSGSSKLASQSCVNYGRYILLLDMIDVENTSQVVLDGSSSLLKDILTLFVQTDNLNEVID